MTVCPRSETNRSRKTLSDLCDLTRCVVNTVRGRIVRPQIQSILWGVNYWQKIEMCMLYRCEDHNLDKKTVFVTGLSNKCGLGNCRINRPLSPAESPIVSRCRNVL